jgi:hypothetical protein
LPRGHIPRRPDAERRLRQADRFGRILKLLELLQGRAAYDAKSLAFALGTTERTVYRDLRVLEVAGIREIGAGRHEALAIEGQDSGDRRRMSYDLNFWKQQAGSRLDPQDVYQHLSEGDRVEGLEDLPIDRILARIADIFAAGWEILGPNDWESSQSSFQVSTTPQSFRVDCYGLTGEAMNPFIDLGQEFGCPCTIHNRGSGLRISPAVDQADAISRKGDRRWTLTLSARSSVSPIHRASTIDAGST